MTAPPTGKRRTQRFFRPGRNCSPGLRNAITAINSPDIHRRIDMLDRAGKKSRFISLRRFAAAAACWRSSSAGNTCSCVRGMNAPLRCAWSRPEAARASSRFPDGTRVRLNGDSRLSYPEHSMPESVGSGSTAKLLFQVRHDASHPFVVDMEVMQVEVLGTGSTPVTGPVLAMPKRSFNRAASVS